MAGERVPLGGVAHWTSGGTPTASNSAYYGGDIPWVTITDMTSGFVSDSAKKLTEAGLASIGGGLAPTGSVLCSMYGTIGKTAMVESPLATNQAIAVGVPDRNKVIPEYLYNAVREKAGELDAYGRGATQRNINRAQLEATLIWVPELSEQRRIVDLLSSADSMVDALATELGAARKVMEDVVSSELLSGDMPRRALGSVLSEIRSEKVADPSAYEYLSVKLYGAGVAPSGKRPNLTGRGRPYYVRRRGEILVGRQNFHNGATGVVGDLERDMVTSNAISAFRVTESNDPRFVLRVMQWPAFYRSVLPLISGTGQKETSVKTLLSLKAPLPSLPVQTQIADTLDACESSVLAASARLDAAKHLRGQLLHDLLSGTHRIPESYDRLLADAKGVM